MKYLPYLHTYPSTYYVSSVVTSILQPAMIPPAAVELSQDVESASENDVVFAMTAVPSGEIFMTAVLHNDRGSSPRQVEQIFS